MPIQNHGEAGGTALVPARGVETVAALRSSERRSRSTRNRSRLVDLDRQTRVFKCPCHNSSFSIDGAIIQPSPSPRAMDTLEAKVDGQEILVQFQNFYTGKTDKVPKA